jgi:hypothetical protein
MQQRASRRVHAWGDTRVVRRVVTCVAARLVLASATSLAALVASTSARADPRAEYSLPFAARPWAPPNLVRLDAAILDDSQRAAVASTLTVGVRLSRAIGLFGRAAWVQDLPREGTRRNALGNPALLAMWSPEIARSVRVPLVVAVTLPLGQGGGDASGTGELAARRALGAGVYARQAMDNALFAPNYLTTAVGAGLARVADHWTLQAEVTFVRSVRTRGATLDPEPARTNFTSAIHVGYAASGVLNLNVEAHWQRWISTPSAVRQDPALRDQLTVGFGVRFDLAIGHVLVRPGFGWFRGVDAPMRRANAHVVVFDLPIVF